MQEVESEHPAGTIGVPMGSLARYTGTFYDLDRVRVPKGTKLVFAEGVNVAYNCNNLVNNMSGEWLWLMGDDHRFQPELLLKLLSHKVDIVAPVVCRRGMPFQTVIYKIASADYSSYMTYSWACLTRDWPNGGLIPVDAAGTAGMLIKKHVLTAIGEHDWFEWGKRVSEDIGFCIKARANGYNIYVDLDATMTHTTSCDLLPYRDKEGKWDVAVQIAERVVSFLNTPFEGKDLREVTYGRKGDGLGWEWNRPPKMSTTGFVTDDEKT